jgi:hypothetical protein
VRRPRRNDPLLNECGLLLRRANHREHRTTARTAVQPPAAPPAPGAGKTAAKYDTPHFVLVPALREKRDVPVPADRRPGRTWQQGPTLAAVPAPSIERVRKLAPHTGIRCRMPATPTSALCPFEVGHATLAGHPTRRRYAFHRFVVRERGDRGPIEQIANAHTASSRSEFDDPTVVSEVKVTLERVDYLSGRLSPQGPRDSDTKTWPR